MKPCEHCGREHDVFKDGLLTCVKNLQEDIKKADEFNEKLKEKILWGWRCES